MGSCAMTFPTHIQLYVVVIDSRMVYTHIIELLELISEKISVTQPSVAIIMFENVSVSLSYSIGPQLWITTAATLVLFWELG